MADDGTMIPISDEQAKLGQEIVKALSGVGAFFEKTLGSVPQDLIGYFGGDWLRYRRLKNIEKMMNRSKKIFEERGVTDEQPASLSMTIPILRSAADESREVLQDLWARLLAATIDPSRADDVRQGFAEAISKMDLPDVLVLNHFKTIKDGVITHQVRASTTSVVGISSDELEISIDNLTKLGLLIVNQGTLAIYLSPFGREFLRVVTD